MRRRLTRWIVAGVLGVTLALGAAQAIQHTQQPPVYQIADPGGGGGAGGG